jgi:hypothetical protein
MSRRSSQPSGTRSTPLTCMTVIGFSALRAHWCTILVLVISDGSPLHLGCCQATALLA